MQRTLSGRPAQKCQMSTLAVESNKRVAHTRVMCNLKNQIYSSFSKQPIKIKSVKKGSRVKNKNFPPSGILHQASDWPLLGDLVGTFSFAPHVTFTELRPDI